MQKRSLPASIVYVAEAIDDPPEYIKRAKRIADTLGQAALVALPPYYHDTPKKPAHLAGAFERLGAWMYICQQAIFEVFFQLGTPSVEVVKGVAFGPYDWTQVIALKTLCRFAEGGIQPEALVNEMAERLPSLRYEALFPAVQSLCATRIKTDTLKVKLEGLIQASVEDEEDPVDVLYMIDQYAYVYPEDARKYRDFLTGMVRGEGLADRHPLLDGAILVTREGGEEEVIWQEGGPPPKEVYSIHAAFLLHRIGEEKEAVTKYLKHWQVEHPDEEVRAHIRHFLAQGA